MGEACVGSNKALDRAIQQQRLAYEDETVIAVNGLIGPSSRFKLPIKQAKTERQKKEAKINYDYHKKLHEMMVDFLLEGGEIGMSVGVHIDPHIKIRSFYNMLNDKYIIPITPKTIMHMRRPKSVHDYVKKIIGLNRTAKGLTSFEKAFMPPSLVAARADRFGLVDRVIRSSLRLTDNTRQAYAEYQAELETVRTGITNNINTHIISGAATVNNSSMDGLYGFTDRDNKKVIIIGEDADTYTVMYEDDPDRARTKVSKNSINVTTDQIRMALVEKYRDELLNDLGHGQVRHIVPMAIPTNKSAKSKWLKSNDGKKVMNKIDRLKYYGAENLKSPDIRTITHKGVAYSYVMVKQGEESVGETYHAYVTRIEKPGVKPRPTVKTGYDAKEFKEALKEGFYKSEVKASFSPTLTKRNRFIKGSVDKRWRGFRRMSRQPNSSIMSEVAEVRADPGLKYNSLWEELLTYRTVFKKIAVDMKSRITNEEKTMSSLLRNLQRSLKTSGSLSKEVIEEMVTAIANMSGAESRVFISKDGTIHSLNAFFSPVGENYFPVKFHRRELDSFVDAAISEMNERKLQLSAEMTKDERDALDTDIEEMEEYGKALAGLDENSSEEYISRLVFLQKAVHTKHRKKFSDHAVRRKDDRVTNDYLNNTYRTLVRNDLIAELVLTVDKMSKLKISPGLLEEEVNYMINRVKVAIGDPNTRAGWGRLRWGNEVIANKMNNLKAIAGMQQNWTPGTSEHLFLVLNGLTTMRLLGSKPALGNRTQSVNDAITYGFPLLFDAWKDYKNPYWQGVINNTGVLNLVSMFQDVMVSGQEVKITDAGMVSHPLFLVLTAGFSQTLPTKNLVNWGRVYNLGREKFIKGALEKTGEKDIKNIYEFLGRQAKKAEGLERRDIEYLAEIYWDLLYATENEQSPEIVRARIKSLVGDIADAKLKKMVAWKLSWNFEPLKELFTFTAGEKALRGLTVVAALKAADAMGALGTTRELKDAEDFDGVEVKVQDRFLSDVAVNIARNAVYSTQFGMSQVYLGEAFGGAGRSGLQYKAYPLQQTIRDYNTFANFANGSSGVGDSIERLLRSQAGAIKHGFRRRILRQEQYKYSPGTKGIDHEARSVVRLLGTRLLASFIAAFIEVLPGIGYSVRLMTGNTAFGAVRSMENPIAGVFMRLVALTVATAADWNDDDENNEIYDDIARLILPVIVSMAIQYIIAKKDMYEEGKLPLSVFDIPPGLKGLR